jgi:hypothetical protein
MPLIFKKYIFRQNEKFIFWLIVFSCFFSFSNAQNMFFHLLPGFGTPFTWVGLGGDANWNTAANWNTGVVPGVNDTATFDDTCVSNCDPLINLAISIGGLKIKSTYAGTITQGAGNTITVGAGGWVQDAGVFNGSNANITTVKFSISNGIFNSTSAVFLISVASGTAANGSTIFDVTGSPTLDFSAGTLKFYASCGWLDCTSYTMNVGSSITVQNLEFDFNEWSNNPSYYLSWNFTATNQITVSNQLKIERSSSTGVISVNALQINLNGNLIANDGANGGNAKIYFQSAGAQTYTGSAGFRAPQVFINKVAGTVTPTTVDAGFETLKIQQGVFTAPTGTLLIMPNGNVTTDGDTVFLVSALGSFTHNNGTLRLQAFSLWLSANSYTVDVDTSLNLNNLDFKFYGGSGHNFTWTIAPGDTLDVAGQLTLGRDTTPGTLDTVVYNGGTINVAGNYIIGVGANAGTTVINLIGGTNTTITNGAAARSPAAVVSVSKPAATISQTSAVDLSTAGQDLSISQGVYNMAGFNLSVNDVLTIGASGKLLCNGGTVTAGSWSVIGEVSCGLTIGITWTGLAGDHLWSTAGNWTNNTVPGAGDVAIFNGICTGLNCNAQIDSNLSVRGIILQNTYTGTLTQNASRTLTIGTAGYTQAGGTFAGGDSAMTINGVYSLSGGTFTATSGVWTQMNSSFLVSGAPTFNHQNGTLKFDGSSANITVSPGTVTYNHVTFAGSNINTDLNAETMLVSGNLVLDDIYYASGWINNGSIEVGENTQTTNNGKYGSAVVKIKGTGAQNLTGTSGYIPSVEINKPSGTLTLVGTITTKTNWTWVSGTVDTGTSTVQFTGDSPQSITPGAFSYYNVVIAGFGVAQDLNAGTLLVGGLLTLGDTYYASGSINNGTIEAYGDLLTNNNGKNGSALVKIVGTGAQSLTGTSGYIPSVEINKPSGTLTMVGTILSSNNWTWVSGTVDAGTSSLVFYVQTSKSIVPGPVNYNNVNFWGYSAVQDLNGGTMIVNGLLTLSDTYYGGGSINNGTIEAHGNIQTTNSGKAGTAILKIVGPGAQSLTGTSGKIPALEINKPSGTLSMAGTITTGSNWTWINGTVDAGTSSLVFYVDGSQTVTPGPINYNNVTFSGYGAVQDLNGGTITITGTLTLSGQYYLGENINNGNIEALGNVVINSYGKWGSALLTYGGATTTNLTWTSGSFLTTEQVVAKLGGNALVFATDANFSTSSNSNFRIDSGIVDLSGFDLNVNSTLTVGAGAIVKCNGGELTTGVLTNSGTVNCPGFSQYDFNWTGAGGNTNWSTPGNWQGGVAPGAGDVVAFQNSTCGATCDSTITTAASVRGLRTYSPFTGTITQAAGQSLTVGTKSWLQNAGTFVGGDSDITVNLPAISGKFNLSGGTFTSTSGQLKIARANHVQAGLTQIAFEVGPGATFNHNNGTLFMNCTETWGGSSKYGLDVNSSLTLYNLIFKADGGLGNGHYVAAGDTLTVLNDFTIQSGLYLPSGNIEVYRNLLDGSSGGKANYGRGVVTMKGASAQTYGYNGTSVGVKMTVDKTGGSLTASTANVNLSTLNVTNGNFTAPTGNLTVGVTGWHENGSKTVMTLASPAQYIDSGGTLIFNGYDDWVAAYQYTYNFNGVLNVTNATFIGFGNSKNIIAGGSSLIVSGTMTHTTGILEGDLQVRGDAVFNSSVKGSATMTFNGSGAQIISGSFPTTGSWTVNKPSGILTMTEALNLNGGGQNLTISSGTLDMAGFDLAVAGNVNNAGTLKQGNNPMCGTITVGGSFSGLPPICP